MTEDLACKDLTGRTVLRRSAGGHGTTAQNSPVAVTGTLPGLSAHVLCSSWGRQERAGRLGRWAKQGSDRYVLAFPSDDPENPFAGSPYAAAT